ncbi:MAG: hypothetical protein A2X64_10860 [Ignavibacteria bacterium GWF2_33_9]|nr:MAG: hypothetical protein A2X64_10860 [Ignavibacteria bacterium GWF2_33_9]
MKIIHNEIGLKISVKNLSFYNRVILRDLIPFFILFVIPIILLFTFEYIQISFINVVLLLSFLFLIFIVNILLSRIFNWYYLVQLEIEIEKCKTLFYRNSKKNEIEFNINLCKVNMNKRVTYMDSIDVIEIYENDKIILEIWPDFAYIGKQWKQEDIYELYDILIDYQNKLKEKESSEEVNT